MEIACTINDDHQGEDELIALGPPTSSPLMLSHILPNTARRVLQVESKPIFVCDGYGFNIEQIRSVEEISTHLSSQNIDHHYDCILFGPNQWSKVALDRTLSGSVRILRDHGQISILIQERDDLQVNLTELDSILTDHGLMRYQSGVIKYGEPMRDYLAIVAVHSTYDPVLHARHTASLGRPDLAIEIIDGIPQEITLQDDLFVNLALEKQRYYRDWMKLSNPDDPPHALFSRERREFAQVTALAPTKTDAYRIHTQCWDHIGRADMARRVWRSIGHLSSEVANQDTVSHQRLGTFSQSDDQETPLWDPRLPAPRILVITHDYSDYGMDTLYHGLCILLGKENVIEYPWKPTLHGQNASSANNYPCVFNYSGEPESVARLEKKLRNGEIDLILFGDVIQLAHGEAVKRLVNANGNIPVVLYDPWDDCYTAIQRVLRYIGRKQFDVMLKREMIDGVNYGQNTFPLPFGYPQYHAFAATDKIKPHSIFWAGKKEYGLRPLYIKSLEDMLGYPLDRQYDQSNYKTELRDSQIGLSFFGCGFDSVRFWEVPANGIMLMSERPPIRIPHNFTDGQSAVFFDDLPEMTDKLNYYIRHPEKAASIATMGHAHYLKHHTCLCRARQMLGIVNRELGGLRSKGPRLHRNSSPDCTASDKKARTYLGLVKGENYGWGVCSKYLIGELPKWRPVQVLKDEDGTAANQHLDGPLFQALTTVSFEPLFEKARGTHNYGYTFFENELTDQSVENAKQYDLILAGSNWCLNRMTEKGISNSDVLIQGIDPNHFYPIQSIKSEERFVIFSGGKFELRKGQDLVLRAVKILQDKYPDIYLLNCWYNLWPESLSQMESSPYISFTYQKNDTWTDTMERVYQDNGLDASRILTMDLVPHHQLRSLYKQTDIGVFPNRCEGGTNLVLMEYMACAKPVIASVASGHKDIVTDENALLLHQLKQINIVNDDGSLAARWQDPSLDELVAQLEFAYLHRNSTQSLARKAGEDLKQFTWSKCAAHLAKILDR